MTPQFLAFLPVAFIFAFTPGATTAVVIRHTLAAGRRRGLTAAAGAMTASAIQATLSLAGVSALVVHWPTGLKVLGLAGAVFLAWIGLKSLRFSIKPPHLPAPVPSTSLRPGRSRAFDFAQAKPHPAAPTPFRDGFAINILNPSVTSFYVGVVPSFAPAGATWGTLAMFYAAHMTIAIGCHVFWSSLFNQARTFFAGERPRRWLDAGVGLLLLWLAIRIATRL